MRQYLYTLEVDRGKSQAIELFILYAVDDADAKRKALKRVPDQSNAQITLKRSTGHFIVAHTEYPLYIDMEEGQHV